MANQLTAKQRRLVDSYEGPGTGIVAGRAAGYRGDDNSVSSRVAKLLQQPKIRAAIEARGVELPPMAEDRDLWPDDGGQLELDPTDTMAFFREIAGSEKYSVRDRMKAMENVRQIEKQLAPDLSADARFAELREAVAEEIAKLRKRRG